MKVLTNVVSSLEKCRCDLSPLDYPRLDKISALRGEHINMQFIFSVEGLIEWNRVIKISAESSLGNIRIRKVKQVWTDLPLYQNDPTAGTEKALAYPGGAYPDILEELEKGTNTRAANGLTSIWADIVIPEGTKAGNYEINFGVTFEDGHTDSERVTVNVIGASLPVASYKSTMWFHVDCLSDIYGVPMYSERHFEIIENYMRNAAENSMTMILLPALTPPLDTAIGHERPSSQLTKIKKTAEGEYKFDFSLLDRYVSIAKKVGIKYFEVGHFFSQWGAKYAPNVMAEVYSDAEWKKERIFGWDTPGTEGEYPVFLSKFIPALKDRLDTLGVLKSCYFHISDEPTEETAEGYRSAKAIAAPHLKGLKIIDACSHPELVGEGLIDIPVPADTNMNPFLALDLPEYWTYYCCAQIDNAPNRFIAYPSYRNRILGIIMYKYNITGFLQWAYNFYYTQGSISMLNPYTDMTGDGWVPAGDTFMVYPGKDGKPIESLRLPVFAEAFSDYEALRLCEALVGREEVIRIIDREGEITFKQYPINAKYILETRERINEIIKSRVQA